MSHAVLLLAIRKEDGKLVLRDPLGREWVCANEKELWGDVHQLLEDPALPKGSMHSGTGESKIDTGEAFDLTCEQIAHMAGEKYGPIAERAAAAASRTGGKAAIKFLRGISRGSK